MAKIVRKLRPTDTWRFGEHESWFRDMSSKGLHLKKMGQLFAKFEKGESKQIEYRMEVSNHKKILIEQIDMYEENGWDYVTSSHYLHVFSSPTERNAPELHTDPAEQAYTMEQLNKEFKKNTIIMAVCTSVMIGIILANVLLFRTPFLRLVEGTSFVHFLGFLVILYQAYVSMKGMLSIQTLRKCLIEGKAINHHAPWKKSFLVKKLLFILILLVALINVVISMFQLVKFETYTLPTGNSDLPFVRLADIEQNPNLKRSEESLSGDADWGYHYTTDWSLLAPKQYETIEDGIIEGVEWADGSGTYTPIITSNVYQLTFTSFAKPLIKDLIKWHTIRYGTESFSQIKHPELDQLITLEQEGRKLVFASEGNVVMVVQYFGDAEMEMIIEKVAEKVKLMAEK